MSETPPKPVKKNVDWSGERLERLRALAQEGLPARLIAGRMGYTRNQIIGAMNRNGIKSAIPDGQHPSGYRYNTNGRRKSGPRKPRCKPLPEPAPEEPALSTSTPPWGLCQWPQVDGFCGKPSLHDDSGRFRLMRRPYCFDHSLRAYQPGTFDHEKFMK